MDITEQLKPDEKKTLLVDDEDWISAMAFKLTKGKTDNSGAGYSIVAQEFLFDCLEQDWRGSFTIRWATDPGRLEQLGHRVIILWYHSTEFEKSYPMGVVSMTSGELWIESRYSYYNAIDLLKAPALKQKIAKLRLTPRAVTVTAQQQELIASIMSDIADNRAIWAECFRGTNTTEAEAL